MSHQTQTIGLSVGLPKIGKRKRDPAFTNNDKRNLIMLVEKHFAIVECKKTDAVSSRAKNNETLQSTVEQSKQQHDVVMRCLLLQEQQEEEKLKQEREKTEQEIIRKKILQAELDKITQPSHNNNF